MTIREFMDELERVRDRFEWHFHADTGWAQDRRARPRFHIRGVAKRGRAAGQTFEPIGAVVYALTGEIHDDKAWRQAGESLELLLISTAELTAAANDRTWVGTEGAREPVEHLQGLRDWLIAAVGLEAKPPSESTPKGVSRPTPE